MTNKLEFIINGEQVWMNEFVANVICDVIHAIIKNLRDVDISEISKIEIS